jgi:hypothetical protein
MMKSELFPKKDEIILSTVTALIVGGLIYQGFFSLWNIKEHTIFQKDPVVLSKK